MTLNNNTWTPHLRNGGKMVAHQTTVGTKIIADLEEITSEKLLILFAGWALFGVNYRFQ